MVLELRRPVGQRRLLAQSNSPVIRTEEISFTTSGPTDIWDLTQLVDYAVDASGVAHGSVTVQSRHTTATLIVNESERGFLNDLRAAMDALVPEYVYYEHDDHELRTENLQPDEFINGHSHCRQALIGSASVNIPIVGGRTLLGRWQRVMFIELDQARDREVIVHVQGSRSGFIQSTA